MRRVVVLLLGLWLCGLATPAPAAPPDERLALLRRGVNVTAWFRYPASGDPARLATYMGDRAITDLRSAGFTFVRLAVDPALIDQPPILSALAGAVRRLRAAGLGVVVSLHPTGWRLEEREADRAALSRAWRLLVPMLRAAGPGGAFPEIVNEPVFPSAAPDWAWLRRRVVAELRAALPEHTFILPGNDWSSIAGLVATGPDADPNVVYTFHFYEPADLTALAPWRNDLDRVRLARLPFPVDEAARCQAVGDGAGQPTALAIRHYCDHGWDAEMITARIGQAAAWARRNGVRLLVGEFGAIATLTPQARGNWLRVVRFAAESNEIGWALWGYDDVMGFALPRPIPSVPTLDPAILRALGLAVRH